MNAREIKLPLISNLTDYKADSKELKLRFECPGNAHARIGWKCRLSIPSQVAHREVKEQSFLCALLFGVESVDTTEICNLDASQSQLELSA